MKLTEGLTVKKLVEFAEGLRGDAFMERGLVYRTNEDYSYAVIPFNLRNLLKGTEPDIELNARRSGIQISSIYDLNDEQYVLDKWRSKEKWDISIFSQYDCRRFNN